MAVLMDPRAYCLSATIALGVPGARETVRGHLTDESPVPNTGPSVNGGRPEPWARGFGAGPSFCEGIQYLGPNERFMI